MNLRSPIEGRIPHRGQARSVARTLPRAGRLVVRERVRCNSVAPRSSVSTVHRLIREKGAIFIPGGCERAKETETFSIVWRVITPFT